MKIEDALQSKKQELEEIQNDIDSLENKAASLKDLVQKYNELKAKSAGLKKIKKSLEKNFNTVVEFFKAVDQNYIDNTFPLFKQQGSENNNSIKEAVNEESKIQSTGT